MLNKELAGYSGSSGVKGNLPSVDRSALLPGADKGRSLKGCLKDLFLSIFRTSIYKYEQHVSVLLVHYTRKQLCVTIGANNDSSCTILSCTILSCVKLQSMLQ